MALTPTQQFCAYLRRIVAMLEKGDWSTAAQEAAEMQRLVATLPAACSQEELSEARQLLAQYEKLGQQLEQRTSVAIKRLGTAEHVRAYGRGAYRP